MKQTIKTIAKTLLTVPLLMLGLSMVTPAAHAANDNCSTDNLSVSSGASCAQGNQTPTELVGDGGIFTTIVNIMLFLVGAVAVIMLIIGGIRYVTSGGSQENVTAAKNTIMYAIIGIVVALLAYAVVQFVVNGIATGTN